MRLIDQANISIDFKSFIFKDDAIGRVLLDKLLGAADRGVKVRLLLDDLWSGNQDKLLSAFDAHPNFEVKLFNPLSRSPIRVLQYLFRFGSITRRMHNKALIVDVSNAIAGGRNIALEYFGLEPALNFADLDVLTSGPVVKEFSQSFNDFWNSKLSIPISKLIGPLSHRNIESEYRDNQKQVHTYENHPLAHEFIEVAKQSKLLGNIQYEWAQGRVIADSPDKVLKDRKRIDLHLSGDMEKLFESTQKEMVIVSPYFLPGKHGLDGFAKKAASGVRIVIITNSLASNNHSLVHAHYAKYRKKLLQAGVEIYEIRRKVNQPKIQFNTFLKDVKTRWNDRVLDKSQVLHAKAFLFDCQKLFIGSLNLDPRSWIENTEIGVLIDSDKLGQEFSRWVNHEMHDSAYQLKLSDKNKIIWKTASGKIFNHEPDSSTWKRFKIKLMAYLPVESLL
ncbi:MAG: phospholipase D family protein [Marinicella sp.]